MQAPRPCDQFQKPRGLFEPIAEWLHGVVEHHPQGAAIVLLVAGFFLIVGVLWAIRTFVRASFMVQLATGTAPWWVRGVDAMLGWTDFVFRIAWRVGRALAKKLPWWGDDIQHAVFDPPTGSPGSLGLIDDSGHPKTAENGK